MLRSGDRAPSFSLLDTAGNSVEDPWNDGSVLLVFFKVTCPVCKMVAPKVKALAGAGMRVVAVGEDPPPALVRYAQEQDQPVLTLSEPPPYEVSTAFGVSAVPSLFLVDDDGVVVDSVGAWDREGWNRLSQRAGGPPVSQPGDGLPPFRPG